MSLNRILFSIALSVHHVLEFACYTFMPVYCVSPVGLLCIRSSNIFI